jgi:hypothetical protein
MQFNLIPITIFIKNILDIVIDKTVYKFETI